MTGASSASRLRASGMGRPAALAAGLGVGIAVTTVLLGPQLTLALVVAVVVVAVAAFMPGVTLAAYFLIPMYKGALQQFSPIDLTVLLALLNAAQLLPLLLDRRHRNVSTTGIALWIAFSALVLAAVFYAPDYGFALGRAQAAWALLFIPIIPAGLRVGGDERYLRQVVLTFVAFGLLATLMGLSSISSGERLVILETNEINTARAVLIVPLMAMLFVPQSTSRLLRAGATVASLLAVVVALGSGARGPLLVLLLIGAVGFLRAIASQRVPDRRSVGIIAGIALLGMVIIASGAIDLPAIATDRFLILADFAESSLSAAPGADQADTSASARILLFRFAVDLFLENPVLGTGTGGYAALGPAALGHFEGNLYPHNAILQVASEYGVLGLLIFGSLVIMALTRRLPVRTHAHAIRLLYVFLLLNAMVSGDLLDGRETWGLMMLLLLVDVPEWNPASRASPAAMAAEPLPSRASSPVAWPVPADMPVATGPYALPYVPPAELERSEATRTGVRPPDPPHGEA